MQMGSGNPRTASKERKGGGPEDHNEKRDISRRLIVNASDDVFSNMQVRKENSSCRRRRGSGPENHSEKGSGPVAPAAEIATQPQGEDDREKKKRREG